MFTDCGVHIPGIMQDVWLLLLLQIAALYGTLTVPIQTAAQTPIQLVYSLMAAGCMRRLFLSPYDLAPSYKNVHNKFSVKYYLNLVLVDEEDRRYFKQQEITLYRASDPAKPASARQSREVTPDKSGAEDESS